MNDDQHAIATIKNSAARLATEAVRDRDTLIEKALILELASRTLRTGIESNFQKPELKERLRRLTAAIDGFFSEVTQDVEREIDKAVARSAIHSLESEDALREVDANVEGSDDEHPEAWATGFSDGRAAAIASVVFRCDLPGSLTTWDEVIAALTRRLKTKVP